MRLLIVGASARAAAASANRAEFQVAAIDRFGDRDLGDYGPHVVAEQFPQQLGQLAADLPPTDGWIYSGPLENYPRSLAKLASERQLLGNPAPVVRRVRNPFRVSEALRRSQLPSLDVCAHDERPATGDWLFKPSRSGGGIGVVPATARRTARRGVVQRFVRGPSIGAVFVGGTSGAALVGVTQQLIGTEWCNARGFQYAGSVGPVRIGAQEKRDLQRVGDLLATEFQLRGLFCVDAILHGKRAWLVEVNPRYSASVEILERALGCLTLRWHVHACLTGELPTDSLARHTRVHGKAILYAGIDITVGALSPVTTPSGPSIADVPMPCSNIDKGQPILTIFADGISVRGVENSLRDKAACWQSQLECSG